MKHSKFKYNCLVILFLIVVGTSLASSNESYASFLAGVLLIEENKNLTSEQKAYEYRHLQQLTGVCGPEALKYIEGFRNRPSEFKKIYTAIIAQLTGTVRDKSESSGNGVQ